MTPDEEILLKQVDENPDDDTLRLVYADAVQERDADLAGLIRLGVRCHCTKYPILLRDPNSCYSCNGAQWLRRCEHEGCREGAFACYLPAWEEENAGEATDTPDGFYCGLHAPDHGFCARCGTFSAGIESFDFSRGGMCGSCQSDVEAEDDEYYRDDDYYDGEDPYEDY